MHVSTRRSILGQTYSSFSGDTKQRGAEKSQVHQQNGALHPSS